MRIVALAGGVGAARFLRGLARATEPTAVTVVGNTGDDSVMHGLHVSPDLDIVTYTLAGIVDRAGWGIAGDTTHALEQLAGYGIETWFTLKDRDLGTHLARTHWLSEGVALSVITERIKRSLRVAQRIIPMTDDPVRTKIYTDAGVKRDFQEYFVKLGHMEKVSRVVFEGAEGARPAPGVVEAIEQAAKIIVCPSNPVLSIGPILSVPGIRESLTRRRSRVTAISPIVAGAALRGPAAALLPVAGVPASAAGVAELYSDFCATMVLDSADEHHRETVEKLGMAALIRPTVMRSPADAQELAAGILAS